MTEIAKKLLQEAIPPVQEGRVVVRLAIMHQPNFPKNDLKQARNFLEAWIVSNDILEGEPAMREINQKAEGVPLEQFTQTATLSMPDSSKRAGLEADEHKVLAWRIKPASILMIEPNETARLYTGAGSISNDNNLIRFPQGDIEVFAVSTEDVAEIEAPKDKAA